MINLLKDEDIATRNTVKCKIFRRIKYGIEAKVSYLWNKTAELKRLQDNWDKLTDEERESFDNSFVI